MTIQHRDGNFRFNLLHVLAISSLSFLGAALHFQHKKRSKRNNKKLVPLLYFTGSSHGRRLERFSHYVARQMGFAEPDECPRLCKLADDYLKKIKGFEENMYDYFSNEEDQESIYSKLIDELDKCILGYFAFHWSQASLVISQALSVESEDSTKFKNLVMAATRKQRFEKVSKDLKVTSLFSTLVVEMKAIGRDSPRCMEVMVPAVHGDRSPVLLLMGGGMGAGKSTVLKDILQKPFWSMAKKNTVVVEADAFKETDVIYKVLSSKDRHSMIHTAELVHQSSTDAASSLLVTALNEGRDVIMDGTLSWEPFIDQTITMARNVHRRRYRMGVGYKVVDDGSVIENYWEEAEDQEEEYKEHVAWKNRMPYRIELVGVVCDAYLAVVRGMRRAILTGRAVRVKSQLKSHKLFANAFPRYCQLVDHATLYCTNDMGMPAKLIGLKDGDGKMLVDPEEIDCLKRLSMLDENAESVYDLYPHGDPRHRSSFVWRHVEESPSREMHQQELKIAVAKIENSKLDTNA